MKKFATVIAAGAIALGLSAQSAYAVKPFLDAFKAKYPNVSGAATAGCNVCHVAGADKKERNAYGAALAALIKKADAKDAAKIDGALEKVAKDNAKFGENLKAGKLPTE
jgi:tRNA(Ile2) C34 agmatinyltransferase TiaS